MLHRLQQDLHAIAHQQTQSQREISLAKILLTLMYDGDLTASPRCGQTVVFVGFPR